MRNLYKEKWNESGTPVFVNMSFGAFPGGDVSEIHAAFIVRVIMQAA
jgi:hypothetical protein